MADKIIKNILQAVFINKLWIISLYFLIFTSIIILHIVK